MILQADIGKNDLVRFEEIVIFIIKNRTDLEIEKLGCELIWNSINRIYFEEQVRVSFFGEE